MTNIKQNKKILIIILFAAALFLVVFFAFFGTKPREEKKDDTFINGKLSTDISLLKDEDIFWALQVKINDYYLLISRNKNEEVYNLLTEEYLKEKDLNQDNAANMLNKNYTSTTFTINKVYYNKDSITTYYFINGCFYDIPVDGDVNYQRDVNILLIVDESNNNYKINPLDDNIEIENFARNYSLEKINITNNTDIQKQKTSERYKMEFYVNYFMKMLYFDTEKAYGMLNEDALKKYSTLEIFTENINTIYSNLFTDYIMLDKEKREDYTRYIIKRNNVESIIIDEYNIMDFKIDFNITN